MDFNQKARGLPPVEDTIADGGTCFGTLALNMTKYTNHSCTKTQTRVCETPPFGAPCIYVRVHRFYFIILCHCLVNTDARNQEMN